MLRNMIRIGRVSSIDYERGKVRVTFDDKDKVVSAYLPLLACEYNMPAIADTVLCLFLSNGLANGFCLGKYFNANSPPQEIGENIYYKDFFGEAFLRYDKDTKTLTLSAENIVIEGDLTVQGNIVATGTVIASNIGVIE